MKKREFNGKSILLIYLITVVISILLFKIFGQDSTIGDLITGLVGALFEFAIARGLIVKRMGDVGDYLEQIKEINLNFFIVNLLFVFLGFLISLISAESLFAINSDIGTMKYNLAASISKSFGLLGLTMILSIVLSLISAYANFVVADPRNKDLSVMEAFKKVFSTGFSLLGKTFGTLLKYTILPVVVFLIIMVIIGKSMSNAAGPTPGSAALVVIIAIAFAICMIYLVIKYKAEISDHYLNLYGDLYDDGYDNAEDRYEEPFKLTREVEVDKDQDETFDEDIDDNIDEDQVDNFGENQDDSSDLNDF